MPRSRSWSLESSTRSSTCWFSRNTPAVYSRRSTIVVLPWSTCAMMATLRMFSCFTGDSSFSSDMQASMVSLHVDAGLRQAAFLQNNYLRAFARLVAVLDDWNGSERGATRSLSDGWQRAVSPSLPAVAPGASARPPARLMWSSKSPMVRCAFTTCTTPQMAAVTPAAAKTPRMPSLRLHRRATTAPMPAMTAPLRRSSYTTSRWATSWVLAAAMPASRA